MKTVKIFSLLFIVVMVNCKGDSSTKKEKYNFSIIYDYLHPIETNREDKYRSKFSNENLYVFIESEFINDTIFIKIGDRKIITEIVNTDPSSGLAKVIEIKNIKKIERVQFSINNSTKICFELIDDSLNLIGVSKNKNDIDLVFYKKVPFYD